MFSGTYPGLADSERLASQPLLWGASVCTYREGAKNSKGLDLYSQDFWKHRPKSSKFWHHNESNPTDETYYNTRLENKAALWHADHFHHSSLRPTAFSWCSRLQKTLGSLCGVHWEGLLPTTFKMCVCSLSLSENFQHLNTTGSRWLPPSCSILTIPSSAPDARA